jgi:hypothetical protein
MINMTGGSWKRWVGAVLILHLCGTVLWFVSQWCWPKVTINGERIQVNPRAVLNLDKVYHLRLWDYEWPVGDEGTGYRGYLSRMVRDFRKIYPNIRVEVTLLVWRKVRNS